MKTLYLQCAMGAAGDMLTAALYELLPDQEKFLRDMDAAGLPGVRFSPEAAQNGGIAGTHMSVRIAGHEEGEHSHGHEHHHHFHLSDIYAILDATGLPEPVIARSKRVYDRIARAEAQVHGAPVEEVHFHEVGALDAVADVLGACYALYLLRPDRVVASPIHVGYGFVRCAHGLLPVPAPATAQLLLGVPTYAGEIEGELCTPTGAALVTEFANAFGQMPPMTVQAIGTGLGKKVFSAPNCLRAFLGQEQGEKGAITELVCNLDDMTPEALAYACQTLLEAGALDVYTQPGTMKKGRPGWVLTVLCQPEAADGLLPVLFRETTSNGVRLRRSEKYFLRPSVQTVQTGFGPVGVKTAAGYGVTHRKPEYEDVARFARESGVPFSEVWQQAMQGEKNS